MDGSVESWDVNSVVAWLTAIGLPQYEKRFRDAEVDGEILLSADDEMLKEIKIKSVGHRLIILKSLQKLRFLHGVDLEDVGGSSELLYQTDVSAGGSAGRVDMQKFEDMLRERDIIIDEIFKQINTLKHEVNSLKLQQSPEDINVESSADQELRSRLKTSGTTALPQSQSQNFDTVGGSISKDAYADDDDLTRRGKQNVNMIRVFGHQLLNHDFESYKSIMVSLTDTCSKVLPLAMKKWKINDDWKKYALFMHFKGVETCLSYDDRPLVLLQQTQTDSETPVFILKSLRTTESMMQIKNEARSSQVMDAIRGSGGDLHSSSNSHDELRTQPGSHYAAPNQPSSLGRESVTAVSSSEPSLERAVAVYEYRAERDDEHNVNIGDTFVVRDKPASGWWVVEKDGFTGWVPAGCLALNISEDDGEREGVALFDYEAIGGNELSIKEGDMMKVIKKYQHWLLAEVNGQQGWVPSCYVSDGAARLSTHSEEADSPMSDNTDNEDNNAPIARSKILDFKDFKSGDSLMPDAAVRNVEEATSGPDVNVALQEFNSTLERLKHKSFLREGGDDSYLTASSSDAKILASKVNSPNSPAISKLDNLLDSFNPYLSSSPGSIPRSKPGARSANKLGLLLTDLGNSMSTWQQELNSNLNSAGTTNPAEALQATQDLADLINQAIDSGNKNYDMIISRLEKILEETSVLATSRSQESLNNDRESQEYRLDDVNAALSRAYAGLNDVASLLLQETYGGDDSTTTTTTASKRQSRIMPVMKSVSGTTTSKDLAALDNSRVKPQNSEPSSGGSSSESLRKQYRKSMIIGANDPNKRNNLATDLVQRDNYSSPAPLRQDSPNGSPRLSRHPSSEKMNGMSISSPPIAATRQFPKRIIPYDQLIKRQEDDVDYQHLESYLSNDECLKYLGCTPDELADMPAWQLNQRKKRANLL